MDPEATLAACRQLSKDIKEQVDGLGKQGLDEGLDTIKMIVSYANDLAEHFDALDNWICSGGFPPEDWKHINVKSHG